MLIIEFRAEIGFAETQAILTTPGLFGERTADAVLGAEIVGRIRTDEEIHVRSLNLYLGEFSNVTFRTFGGGTIAGSELIGRFWDGMVEWATVIKPANDAERAETDLFALIDSHPEAARIRAEFDAAGT